MTKKFIILLFIAALAFGCATTKVDRVKVEEKVDLSGKWNDYDATTVSKDIVADCLSRPWVNTFIQANGRNPVIIVGTVINRSSEHINTQVMTKYLEKEVMNSGKVTFVAARDERLEVRAEREDQQKGLTDPSTIKQIGKEKGADFMLIGSINSIKDEIKGKYVIYYQTNMELIDITTNEKVWLGQKEIKKIVKRSRFSI